MGRGLLDHIMYLSHETVDIKDRHLMFAGVDFPPHHSKCDRNLVTKKAPDGKKKTQMRKNSTQQTSLTDAWSQLHSLCFVAACSVGRCRNSCLVALNPPSSFALFYSYSPLTLDMRCAFGATKVMQRRKNRQLVVS